VPTHLPLDAELPAEEAEARAKIERAKLICGQRASGTVLRVRPGQAGKAIVQRARELKAAAIVMQLRYRNGTPLYGKTLQTVLAKRPCRVIVAAEPGEVAASRGLASEAPSPGPAPAGAQAET
jgi:APA family basic amino acid/polyamine antiporter